MKISIKSTKIKLNPALKEFIEKKIGPLEKFIRVLDDKDCRSPSGKSKSATEVLAEVKKRAKFSSPLEAFVEIEKGTHHKKGPFFRAECQLRLPEKIIRSEAVSADLRTALDDVRADLQGQLKGQKAKMTAKFKRKSRILKTHLKISPSARFYKGERNLEEGI